jgi:betaine-aldehyde dehydrogenase
MARFELQKLYIDGGYSDAGSDATFEAINPANGEVLAKCNAPPKKTLSVRWSALKKARKSGPP